MADSFDAIVIGMGPEGEVVATRLLDAGRRIAVVERELIGGECGSWACVPSTTLLGRRRRAPRPPKGAGVEVPRLDWQAAAAWRDQMTRHLDDAKQVREYQERCAEVLRGSGRLDGPGRVQVRDRVITPAGGGPGDRLRPGGAGPGGLPGPRGLAVDDRCRVADGLWAVGDSPAWRCSPTGTTPLRRPLTRDRSNR
jgi:hypothetical protein